MNKEKAQKNNMKDEHDTVTGLQKMFDSDKYFRKKS